MATTTKKQSEENPAVTFIDSTWDVWKNSMDMFYSTHKEAGNMTLRALEQQQQLWESLQANVDKAQNDQKALREELRDNLRHNIASTGGDEAKKSFDQWNDRFEEVVSRFQQLTLTPYREMSNVLNRSQEQFQETVKKSLNQQEKSREELKPLFEDFSEQMKKTQNGFHEVSEKNRQLALSYLK